MAREHGRILVSIWSDADFCARSPEAQRLYFLMLTQRTINNAGVLPLMTRKWSRGSADTSEEDVQEALNELCEHEFVVVDEDTDEALVRSFIRNDGVVKQPNILKNALRQVRETESPKLRLALARELRRIGLDVTREVANEIDPEPTPNPSGNPSVKDSPNPSETHENNPSGTLQKEPFANPSATPAGMGMGLGMGSSPSVGGLLGGPHAHAHTREATPPQETQPEQRPTERCPKHANDPDPPNCGQCADRRRAAEAWDVEQARHAAEQRSVDARRRAETKAAAIANCPLCDNTGYAGTALCNHDPHATDRAKRGRALVDAALSQPAAAAS